MTHLASVCATAIRARGRPPSLQREALNKPLPPNRTLAVAVACSGLGHIRRGIESWAQDLGQALRRAGVDVTLFGGAPTAEAALVPLPCLRRGGRGAILLAKLFRHIGGWRYGLGSPYEVEQTTFALLLWRRIRRDFDVLHVQDPLVAKILDALHRLGLSRPRVIMANGTGEGPGSVARLSIVQYLTPAAAVREVPGQVVFVEPNFIDVAAFRPGDRGQARQALGLPEDAFIVLSCAAIRRYHKRADVVMRAFALFVEQNPAVPAFLVVAGGHESDTDELVALGTDSLGDHIRFLVDFPRSRMAQLYRAADVFVLGSLYETFGIVLLEAMASGIPVVCHDTDAFRYVVGDGGVVRNIERAEDLASALDLMLDPVKRASLARAARAHVEANFSEAAVIPRIAEMYAQVAEGMVLHGKG
jgi:1,2-diacylglycerol 3-alpha-glucosyltransferase